MVYIFFADGFEELEALSPVDALRRAGVSVTTVGVGSRQIIGAHQIPILCDTATDELDAEDLEMIVLPGGMPGTTNLEASSVVMSVLDKALADGKWIAAICAAPSILGHRGILKGKKAICFPGFEDALEGAELFAEPICVDGNIITAKGAGVALEFALTLVACLKGKDAARVLKETMQCRG